MGCSVSKSEDVLVTVGGERTSKRRASASGAESTGEAEKASSASTLSSQLADAITLVHFNDVYNIEERDKEPCGGAPRFKTQVDSLRELDPLIVFSGDALNPSNSKYHLHSVLFMPCLNCAWEYNRVIKYCAPPSLNLYITACISVTLSVCLCVCVCVCVCAVSIVMQGKQMVPILNSLGIHASVYGNHDFGEFVLITY